MEKARIIWDLMSPSEKEYTRGVINFHVSDKSLAVFFSMISGKSRELIFKEAIGKTYQKKDDYLLRNEYRLVMNALRRIVISMRLKSEDDLYPDIIWLRWLSHKGNEEFFRKESDQILKQSIKNEAHHLAAEVLKEQFNFYKANKELSLDLFYSLHNFEIKRLKELEIFFSREVSELHQKIAFSTRSQKAWEPTTETHKVPEDITVKLNGEDLISTYFYIKGNSYSQTGEQKLKALSIANELIDKIGNGWRLYAQEKKTIYGSQGLEFFFSRRYEEAVRKYDEALSLSVPGSPELAIKFNLVNALLKLRKYAEVEKILEDNQKEINKSENVKYRYNAILCMTRLFLKKTKEAKGLLDHDLSKRPVSENYYYRFLFAIVYWQENEFDLAQNEIRNMLRVNHREDQYVSDMRQIGSLFRSYFQCIGLGEKKRDQLLDKTIQEADEFSGRALAGGEDFLPLLWLKDELKRAKKRGPKPSSVISS